MKRLLALIALLLPLAVVAAPLDLLTFSKIQVSISEGDVLQIAGPPDSVIVDSERPVIVKSYYYFAKAASVTRVSRKTVVRRIRV
ncbi:MAG: hypothetical protein AB7U30_12595 [Sulfuricellaceae bacterium]|jgi:hypothetical protein